MCKANIKVSLRRFFVTLVFLALSNLIFCQSKNIAKDDMWSGTYKILPHNVKNYDTLKVQLYSIEKTVNANPKDIAGKYESDLLRWNLFVENGADKETVSLRRFLINKEDDEYKEFGWTELHKAGKMNCLDGGHLFICSTTPNSTIKLGEEKFTTKTGIFGIMLHKGLFDFYKVE